jgi:AbrB family looped-hinge helix DNA binding protein
MTLAHISSKGQITLPSSFRKKLGIKDQSTVEVELRGTEIVIRPMKSIREVHGIFSEFAKGKSEDWETVRSKTEEAVAEEVANEGK